MKSQENTNQQTQTSKTPSENPLLSVQTSEPATQNRNFELEGNNKSNGNK